MASKRELRARFSYATRKDGIAIGKLMSQDLWNAIKSPEAIPENLEKEAIDKIGELLQWYAAIYRQKLFGTIEDDEWDVHLKALGIFLGMYHIREYWEIVVSVENGWSEQFVKFGGQFVDSERGRP